MSEPMQQAYQAHRFSAAAALRESGARPLAQGMRARPLARPKPRDFRAREEPRARRADVSAVALSAKAEAFGEGGR